MPVLEKQRTLDLTNSILSVCNIFLNLSHSFRLLVFLYKQHRSVCFLSPLFTLVTSSEPVARLFAPNGSFFRLLNFTSLCWDVSTFFTSSSALAIVTRLQAILASRFRKSQKAEKGGLGDSLTVGSWSSCPSMLSQWSTLRPHRSQMFHGSLLIIFWYSFESSNAVR